MSTSMKLTPAARTSITTWPSAASGSGTSRSPRLRPSSRTTAFMRLPAREGRSALLDEGGDALGAVLGAQAPGEAVGLPAQPFLERQVARRPGELAEHADRMRRLGRD